MSNKFKNSNINIANKSFNNIYFFHYSVTLVIYMYRIYTGNLLYCITDSNISHKIWFLFYAEMIIIWMLNCSCKIRLLLVTENHHISISSMLMSPTFYG
jgi:hypothetical protein